MQAPQYPDPYETAQAQAGMNKETAITQFGLNAYTQNNPWGTVNWEQTGTWEDGTPRYTQTTELSPDQQATFDSAQAAQQNLAGLAADQSGAMRDYLQQPFEYSNQDAENWAYDLASPRILEQQRQTEAAMIARLRNSGIAPGSAAWDAEMARMTNANTDQLNQLALTGRQQGFAEALAQRNQPINEISALLSGSQVSNPAQMSSPGPQTGVAGVDYTGLVNEKFKADNAAYQSGMGGLFGLGSALIGALPFSDARLKTDIRRVGQTDAGVAVYTYRYKGDETVHMGVMAQDVPEARVVDPATGFYRVDYRRVH